jgi:hypothetical protein
VARLGQVAVDGDGNRLVVLLIIGREELHPEAKVVVEQN